MKINFFFLFLSGRFDISYDDEKKEKKGKMSRNYMKFSIFNREKSKKKRLKLEFFSLVTAILKNNN